MRYFAFEIQCLKFYKLCTYWFQFIGVYKSGLTFMLKYWKRQPNNTTSFGIIVLIFISVPKKVKVNFNFFSQNYLPRHSKAILVFLPCLTTSFQATTLKTQITELKIIDIFPQHMELYHLKRFSYILTVNCALNARKLSKWQDVLLLYSHISSQCYILSLKHARGLKIM